MRIRFALTGLLLLIVATTAASAVAADSPAARYRVRRGDSLSLIAQRFGTTVTAIKQANSLAGDIIHIGDDLELAAPFRRTTRRPHWRCPVAHPGPIVRPFGPYQAGGILMPRTGTDLAAAVGTQLYSPADGVVRHSGPLDGFGHILIIEHPNHYATVLAPCDPSAVTVAVGQAVLAGDRLARTGPPPEPGAKPYVHIELRHRDKAVAPDRLLR